MNNVVYFLGTNDTTRQSAELLAGAMGYTICAEIAESDFLSRYRVEEPCCVVFNSVGRDFVSTLNWCREVVDANASIRIIMICSECGTSDVVNAMRKGVSSVLELPFSYKEMEQAIDNALQESDRALNESRNRLAPNIAAVLTRQEQEIAQMLLDGAGTKQISVKLDLSIRTIHYRKKAMFSKLGSNADGHTLRALLSGSRSLSDDGSVESERECSSDRQRQSSMN